MRECLWLPIAELQLRPSGEIEKTPEGNTGHFVLDTGPFAMFGLTITKQPDGNLSIGTVLSNGKFLDTPFCRRGKPEATGWPFLEDMLLEAILARWRAWLLAYLEEGVGIENLLPWKPVHWEGRQLAIPVDFVKVSKLFRPQGMNDVYGHVQVGRHLIFWEIRIAHGDGFSLGSSYRVQDAAGTYLPFASIQPDGVIGKALLKMWDDMQSFRETVCRTTSTLGDDSSFTLAVPEAEVKKNNSDVLPPRLHFWNGEQYIPA